MSAAATLQDHLLRQAEQGMTIHELFEDLRCLCPNRRKLKGVLEEMVENGQLYVLGKNLKIYFTAGSGLQSRVDRYLEEYSRLIEDVLLNEHRWVPLKELRTLLSRDIRCIKADSTLINAALEKLHHCVQLGRLNDRQLIRHIEVASAEPEMIQPDPETYVVDSEMAEEIREAAVSALERSSNDRFAYADLQAHATYLGHQLPEREITLNYLIEAGICNRIMTTLLPMFEAGPQLYAPARALMITVQDVSAAQQNPGLEKDWRDDKTDIIIIHTPEPIAAEPTTAEPIAAEAEDQAAVPMPTVRRDFWTAVCHLSNVLRRPRQASRTTRRANSLTKAHQPTRPFTPTTAPRNSSHSPAAPLSASARSYLYLTVDPGSGGRARASPELTRIYTPVHAKSNSKGDHDHDHFFSASTHRSRAAQSQTQRKAGPTQAVRVRGPASRTERVSLFQWSNRHHPEGNGRGWAVLPHQHQ